MRVYFSNLHRLFYILQILLGLFIIVSLIYYEPADCSYNVATDYLPNNLLGCYGSYVADILVQTVGIGSYLIGLLLLRFAYFRIKKIHIKFPILRIVSVLFCAIMFSFIYDNALQLLGSHSNCIGAFSLLIKKYTRAIEWFYIIPISSILFILSGLYAFAINLKDVWGILHRYTVTQNHSYNQKQTYTQNFGSQADAHNPIQRKVNSIQKPFSPDTESLFKIPPTDLLNKTSNQVAKLESMEQLRQNAQELLVVLSDFGIIGNIINIHQGPVVTLYEFEPSAGTKSSRVIGLADDIARSLCALSTRISTVPGRNVLGIEIPNKQRMFFNIRELLETKEYRNQDVLLPIVLGKDLNGEPYVVDLAKMPHLLVAGTTGSGKSVAINTMIFSLLYRYTPEDCKFIMIDPKMLELSMYDDIPHLLIPVVTEPSKAITALKWAVKEMENRYRMMSSLGVRNISGFNARVEEAIKTNSIPSRTVQIGFDPETGNPTYQTIPIAKDKLPFIVVIVDEMADLMLVAGKDIEASVQRLAQMARAAGIHIIMATQRPSVDVITGVIKANFPSRVSFKVTSKIDSRTILGQMGAEQLLGMGDMLYMGNASQVTRVHCPFVDDKEVMDVTSYLKSQAKPNYVMSVLESTDKDENIANPSGDMGDDDGLYRQAIQIVKKERKVSTSYIQRCLRIGYNRAAIIVERMEKEGIVSPPNHTGKREILLPE